MNLTDARKAARFAHITKTPGGAVGYKVSVPGHDGKRYLVLIRHETRAQVDAATSEISKFVVVTGECLLDVDRYGMPKACPSKSTINTICYHALAAVIAIAEAQKLETAFAENETDAQRVKNLHAKQGSKMFRVGQHEGYKYAWVVTWEKE